MSINPLNSEQLKKAAPSIFSKEPIKGVSKRYAFVPTYTLVDNFKEVGYYPIMASQSRVNKRDNLGYQKHIIQFRHIDNLMLDSSEYADIVLTNSHNKTSSFVIDLAIFRVVCKNMLVVPDKSFIHHSIIHSGFNKEKVKRAISEVTSYIPKITEDIKRYKDIKLNPIEKLSLAKVASNIRFDPNRYKIEESELLKIRRDEDRDSSLWSTLNTIQEALIRGGVRGVNRDTNKTFTSKAIRAIDSNLKINKELFSVASKVADLKVA